MKSILTVFLTAVLAVSAFTGCGTKKNDTRVTPKPAPTATAAATPGNNETDRDMNDITRDENGTLKDENGTLRDEDGTVRDENGEMVDTMEDGLVENGPLADDGVAEPTKNG